MAEEAIKKLEEQLKCSICLDTFTDPKLLQCFHVYCRQCLVPLVDRDQQGHLGLSCPTCRRVTPIPNRGVAGLQPAFHINHLLELNESFQKVEDPAAALQGEAPTPVKKVRCCFDHEGKELELYCETCGELICWKCIAKGGKHREHDYEELSQAFEKYRQTITSSLKPMEKQMTIIKKALAQLDTCCGEISDQRAATAVNIHVTFSRFREILDVRETELIGQLDRVTQEKLKGLAAQRDQIETTLAQLCSCLHFMSESLQPGNEEDVLMMKSNTVNQVKEFTTPFQPDMLEPNTKADVIFSALADLTTLCENYGQVFLPGSPDPSKCHITGNGADLKVSLEMCTAILQVVNFEGEPCKVLIKFLECEFVSEITGTRANCSVERRGQSQYKIGYQPTIKGKHQLHIKVEGQHIRGSPFSVAVKMPVDTLSAPILTIDRLKSPWGVAVNQRGEVVVTEKDGHFVSVFSPNGEEIRSFGTQGSGHGQFQSPRGVAVDGEGNILIVDGWNHRIQKFTAEGKFLAAVGKEGSEHLQFKYPLCIAYNTNNNKVYIADTSNNRIQVLNSDLTFSRSFGMGGRGKGGKGKGGKGKGGKDKGHVRVQFEYPYGIACDSTGKVYVADTDNKRVQVFTPEGIFLRMFDIRIVGQRTAPVPAPYCIAIDSSDIIYLSTLSYGDRICLFTSEGRFLTSFGRGLKDPHGLAVDNSGVLYVCYSNCVHLF